MIKKYKQELKDFINLLDKRGERIIDILLELQRLYQLDTQELYKLLSKEQKAKLKEQELILRTIKE